MKKNKPARSLDEARLDSLLRIANFPAADAQALLDFALDEAIKLTGSTIGYIYHYHEDRKEFVLNTWSEGVMEVCNVTAPKTVYQLEKTGLWGEAVRQRRPILLNDYQAPNPLKKGCPEGHAPLHRFLTIPVIRQEAVVAVVGVANSGSDYTETDVRQLTLLMDGVWKSLDQQKARDALKESEQRFRRITEAVTDYIYTVRIMPDGRFETRHGPGCEAVTGYKEEDFMSDPYLWIRMVFPEELELVKERSRRASAGEEVEPYEHRIIRKDGQVRWVLDTPVQRLDEKGRRTGYDGLIHDITEGKQAEQAIREKEEKYRRLYDEMIDGYALHDILCDSAGTPVDYVTLEVNHTYETLLGAKAADVVGRKASGILPPEELRKWLGIFGPVALTGRTAHYEMHSPLNNKWFTGTVFCPAKGKFATTFSDITESRRADESLQRTEKLESLGLLAGGIAHDFNNLLGGILGYVDLARKYVKSGDNRRAEEYLTRTVNSFDRARDLTRQLLTFSKGGAPIKKIQHVDALVLSAVQFSLAGSNVQASFDIPEDLWPCDIDENQIGQAVDNITLNARQAMPMGGPFKVRLANVPAEKAPKILEQRPYVRASFEDKGTGIAPDHLKQLFDPFFTTKQAGSGLGLTTTHSIIHRHNGMIEVESELGKGTVFHFYLPAAPGEAVRAATRPMKAAHKGQGRILLMDDESDLLEMFGEMVTDMGYEAVVTTNGDEALESARKAREAGNPFFLAILDLTVPGGKGGREIVATLKEMDPAIKVIASSGYSADPIMADPAAYGFSASLPKPYGYDSLGALLQKLI